MQIILHRTERDFWILGLWEFISWSNFTRFGYVKYHFGIKCLRSLANLWHTRIKWYSSGIHDSWQIGQSTELLPSKFFLLLEGMPMHILIVPSCDYRTYSELSDSFQVLIYVYNGYSINRASLYSSLIAMNDALVLYNAF